ncbi:MAG: signal recognition particle-docking protein FtsY, partial [Nitrosotalea sp.]
DTAGRMQTSKNLMDQISKINKVVNPDLKLFVGDSLAGNDTVSQAREFYNYTTFDGAILTKSDADARGGAAISIVKVTSSPILYLGIGQEYKDLKSFDKGVFLESLFGPEEVVEGIKKRVLEPKVELKPEPKVELKPEPKVELKPEPKVELKPEPKVELKPDSEQEISEDLFAGISTKDIEKYSDLFDVPPPENDGQARKLASDIRQWISAGRPKNKQKDELKTEYKYELKTEKETNEESNDEKPIKKRSLFGWMKK